MAGGPSPSTGEINVTPMIDVLLVLIVVFFLLNLPMPFVPIVVPPMQTGVTVGGTDRQLILELPELGGFTLNGQPVPDAEFDAMMHSVFDARPVKLLFVNAGPSRTYREVVDAMERARLDGVEVVAFLPAGVASR